MSENKIEILEAVVEPQFEAEPLPNREDLVDYRTLTDTDQDGTEWVDVEYTYECPIDNYVEGTTTETITTRYKGPKELHVWVRNDGHMRGTINAVYRDWESNDGRPIPDEITVVIVKGAEQPLLAEVLSDYHDNYKDMEDYLDTPGMKTIPETPIPGYTCFEYEYPIHPDVLYDDKKTTYNFDTEEFELYRNTNEDIIGPANDWAEIRRLRNIRLALCDAQYLSLKEVDPDKAAKLAEYRQYLRDLPEALKDIPLVFVDSCFPYTKLIEI